MTFPFPLFCPAGFGAPVTAFSATLTADQGSVAGYSTRGLFSLSTAGVQVRVKFEAPAASSITVDNASVGIHSASGNTTAVPVELLFSGISGFTMTAGQTIFSDWTALVQGAVPIIVVIDTGASNGNWRIRDAVGQGQTWGAAATNSYNVQSPSLPLVGGNLNVCVPLIEVRS